MYGNLWSCTQNILPIYWKKSFCTKLTLNRSHIYEYLCISMHTWPHRIQNIPHCLKSWTYCHGECTNMWRAVLSYGYKIKINVHNCSEWKSISRQNTKWYSWDCQYLENKCNIIQCFLEPATLQIQEHGSSTLSASVCLTTGTRWAKDSIQGAIQCQSN